MKRGGGDGEGCSGEHLVGRDLKGTAHPLGPIAAIAR